MDPLSVLTKENVGRNSFTDRVKGQHIQYCPKVLGRSE